MHGMIAIRAARPEDTEFLGWAIHEAARGHLARGWFDIVLQRDRQFCLEFCRRLTVAAARSWWHWSLFSVADVDGARASALCGFGDESVYRASGEAMKEASNAMGISEAERAYRKAGFTFAEEKRASEFEAAMGAPGLRRLARDI